MLHKYRKTALIEAEQFDGSDEMANKYGVLWDLDGVRIYWIPYLPTKKGKMFIKKGDWIATDADGEHWVIDKDVFKRTYERMNKMKTKLFLMSATLLAALSLTGVASADTTRDQIEAEGNQQIQAYWNEYQQALQDRQNAWEQSHGDIYTPAWQDANAHAGAAYREWLEARTALGDRLHAYDVAQWEKESDQPSNQTPVDDSQVPEENSQALNTQGSQATVPTSQSATPASQAKLSSQPATQELTQQASVADPASQPITQSTAQKPQQASVSVQADKTGNLPAQNKKPAQSNTVQNDQQTKLPQTGNSNLLTVVGILLFAFLGILIGVWKFFDARRGGKR